MNTAVILQIIFTHLVSRKRQTIVASLGVTFGIGFYIALVGFMNGTNLLVEDLMLSATPHVRMFNDIVLDSVSIAEKKFPQAQVLVHSEKPEEKSRSIKNAPEILQLIKKDERVYGASPRVASQVYYTYGTTEYPGTILGVDLPEEDKLFLIRKKIVVGSLESVLSTDNGIMMGGGLAEKLGAKLGDRVPVTLPNGSTMYVTVAAIFRMGVAQIDNAQSYASLRTAQKLLHKDNRYITDINIKLHKKELAKDIAQEYRRQFSCTAEDWETFNASILVSFTMRNFISYAVSISMLIVAGFGIYNIMTMMMYEKMKDIAILRAIGFESRDIRGIFLGQALALGILGGIAGLIFGFLMSLGISLIPYKNDYLPGMESLPVDFSINTYVIGIIFALISSGFAGVFPARRAAKVDPVVIIRG